MSKLRPSVLLFAGLHLATPHLGYAGHEKPECKQVCCSPFGVVIGKNAKTIAYSNCNNDYESQRWQSVRLSDGRTVKTGMQWQCVEYARRWLIMQKHISFASIDHAYQIWDLAEASHILTGKSIPWVKAPNAKTRLKPQKGDLLIYDRSQGVHGHVSVIVDVQKDWVMIGEQNYSNLPWEKPHYARKLHLVQDEKGYYALADQGVIGWMRAQSK